MKDKRIEKLRESVIEGLREYKESGGKDHINLDINKVILQSILFEKNKFAIPYNLWKLLDLSDVSFDGIYVEKVDFTGSKGVVINPQKVKYKSLYEAKLKDVEINGSFFLVNVQKTDFTGSKGAVLDPQTVRGNSLEGTKLTDVEIKGSLDGVYVDGADFTGSKGAKMDLDIAIAAKELGTNLTDVEIIDPNKDIIKETEEKIAKIFQKTNK